MTDRTGNSLLQASTEADVLSTLAAAGLEPDQRLRTALELAPLLAQKNRGPDAGVFLALCHLNAVSLFDILQHATRPETIRAPLSKLAGAPRLPPATTKMARHLRAILARAAAAASRSGANVIGTRDYLLATLEMGMEHGDSFGDRPFAIDTIVEACGLSQSDPLSMSAVATALVTDLRRAIQQHGSDEDFQFLLSLKGGRLVFSVVSVLGDVLHATSSTAARPQRALLRHIREQFGGFLVDEIDELEDLINNPLAGESDFQKFFERHPHFLRKWDHREVHPHVVLARPEGDLVPDFILTDRELQRSMIVELKLPAPKIVRRQHNRDRFAAAVSEARAQLLEYREWFRERANRELIRDRLGMQIYEPELTVIVGRASEFVDDLDRQRLHSRSPDVEVVTYDDLLLYAKRRRLVIGVDAE